MPSRALLSVVATALAIAACSGAPPANDPAADDQVRAAMSAYTASLTVGPDSTGSFFDESGTMLGAGIAPVIGRKAIIEWLAPLFKANAVKDAGSVVQAVDVSGDLATVWGTYHQYAGPRGGEPVSYNGRFVAAWKRGADGRWRIVLMMTQADPLAAVAPAKGSGTMPR